MTPRRLLFLSILAATTGACKPTSNPVEQKKDGGQNADPNRPAAPFLGADIFGSMANLNAISAASIASEINSDSTFLNYKGPGPGSCFETLLNQGPLKANATTVVADFTVDATDCMNQSQSQGSAKFQSVKARVYVYGNCVGEDISRLNGKTFLDLRSQEFCPTGSRHARLSNSEINLTSVSKTNASATMTTRSRSASMTRSAQPCTWTKASGVWSTSDCAAVERTENTSTEATTNSLRTFDFRGITTRSSIDRTYSTGVMHFVIDDWEGDMTYTSGAASWRASNRQTTKSGQFSYTP